MYSAKLRLRLVVEYLVVIIYSTVLRARRTGLALVVGLALRGLAQVEEFSNRREGTVIGFSANADVQDATANKNTIRRFLLPTCMVSFSPSLCLAYSQR